MKVEMINGGDVLDSNKVLDNMKERFHGLMKYYVTDPERRWWLAEDSAGAEMKLKPGDSLTEAECQILTAVSYQALSNHADTHNINLETINLEYESFKHIMEEAFREYFNPGCHHGCVKE